MKKLAIIYHSAHGHTEHIANRVFEGAQWMENTEVEYGCGAACDSYLYSTSNSRYGPLPALRARCFAGTRMPLPISERTSSIPLSSFSE